MNDQPPQDQRRPEPPQADHASESHSGDSPISGADSSVTQGRGATEGGEESRAAPMQDADHALKRASDGARAHDRTSPISSKESTAKESVQSIPLVLPQGGNPAEHLTPEKLLEIDTSQRRAREVPIQSPAAISVRQPVRYDTVLFAPKVPPKPLGNPAPDDNAEPVGQSPFQMSGPKSSSARSVTDSEVPESPPSKTVGSDESEFVPAGADPGLSSNEASGEQQLPRRGDRPPWSKAQFDDTVQLSDPHSDSAAAAASGGSSPGTTPPQSSGSTTAQPPPAGEKAAPLPRVIVMVGLDDAERIVHEEMRVFSRELAIVTREIAQEEVTNAQFDYQAQLRALIR